MAVCLLPSSKEPYCRRLPVSELAPLLGYSETSAFSRAFRRWFDCTPGEYRARH